MPRRRIHDANQLGNAKPKRKAAEQTPPTELSKRRRMIATMVARNMQPDDIRAMMQHEFPEMKANAIEVMRQACSRMFEQETQEAVHLARVKQRARLFGVIGAAMSKGAYGAVAQFEKLLADIDGTLAPRRLIVQTDAATKEKLAAVLVQLPEKVLFDLAGGRFVPLGYTGNLAPALPMIEASGTSDDD